MTEPSNQKQKIIDKVIIHVKSDPDDNDIPATNKDNIEYIKDKVFNILDYSGNTTEYPTDGTIVITPRYLKSLPNEIVDQIIFYVCTAKQRNPYQPLLQNDLYQCSLVSKQFYQQTNRFLWCTPVIINYDMLDRFVDCLTNTQIVQQTTNPSDNLTLKNKQADHHSVPHNMLMAKHHIRRLDMTESAGWNDIQFSLAMPFLNQLEILSVDYNVRSKVTDASLQYLPRYCPYITTLAFVPTTRFTQRFIRSCIQNCHHLSNIELNLTVHHLYPDIFKSLLDCRSLTTLILQKINPETNGNGSILSEHMVMDMMALKRLTGLALLGQGMASTLHSFFTIIQHGNTDPWPLLSSFRIDYGGIFLGDNVMIPFIESHPHLKFLLIGGSHFSDVTLDRIATHLPGLIHLRLGGNNVITKDGVYSLVRRCHHLKHAEFPNCLRLLHSMEEFPRLQRYEKYALSLADMDKIRQLGDFM